MRGEFWMKYARSAHFGCSLPGGRSPLGMAPVSIGSSVVPPGISPHSAAVALPIPQCSRDIDIFAHLINLCRHPRPLRPLSFAPSRRRRTAGWRHRSSLVRSQGGSRARRGAKTLWRRGRFAGNVLGVLCARILRRPENGDRETVGEGWKRAGRENLGRRWDPHIHPPRRLIIRIYMCIVCAATVITGET